MFPTLPVCYAKIPCKEVILNECVQSFEFAYGIWSMYLISVQMIYAVQSHTS